MLFYEQVKCPVPGCDHCGELITVSHCESAHGMARRELFKEYGNPEALKLKPGGAKKNMETFHEPGRINPGYPSDKHKSKTERTRKHSNKAAGRI